MLPPASGSVDLLGGKALLAFSPEWNKSLIGLQYLCNYSPTEISGYFFRPVSENYRSAIRLIHKKKF